MGDSRAYSNATRRLIYQAQDKARSPKKRYQMRYVEALSWPSRKLHHYCLGRCPNAPTVASFTIH